MNIYGHNTGLSSANKRVHNPLHPIESNVERFFSFLHTSFIPLSTMLPELHSRRIQSLKFALSFHPDLSEYHEEY